MEPEDILLGKHDNRTKSPSAHDGGSRCVQRGGAQVQNRDYLSGHICSWNFHTPSTHLGVVSFSNVGVTGTPTPRMGVRVEKQSNAWVAGVYYLKK